MPALVEGGDSGFMVNHVFHLVRVPGEGYVAICSCGWTAPPSATTAAAEGLWDYHVNEEEGGSRL